KSILPSVCQQSGSFPPCCYTHIKGGGSRPAALPLPRLLDWFGQRTTRLTILPGTTICLTICLPSIACCTFSSASAVSMATCLSQSTGSLIVHLSLPLTCTAISTVSSTVLASSYCGHGAMGSR